MPQLNECFNIFTINLLRERCVLYDVVIFTRIIIYAYDYILLKLYTPINIKSNYKLMDNTEIIWLYLLFIFHIHYNIISLRTPKCTI